MRIKAAIETAIYVDDLQAAEAFYRTNRGLRPSATSRAVTVGVSWLKA